MNLKEFWIPANLNSHSSGDHTTVSLGSKVEKESDGSEND